MTREHAPTEPFADPADATDKVEGEPTRRDEGAPPLSSAPTARHDTDAQAAAPDAVTESDAAPVAPAAPPLDDEFVSPPLTPSRIAAAARASALDDVRYRVTETLGRGGMGEVVRAKDQRLLRDVALKRVRQADAESVARFTAEARIGGQLDHPAVLPVYDYGLDESGAPYFAMKLVDGHLTLHQVLHRLRAGDEDTLATWSFQRRVALAQTLCRALAHAHSRGVIHRDLKPANIVLGTHGEVYIVDWGIAQVDSESPHSVQLSDEVRTALDKYEAEGVVGTLPYMAPEHLLHGTCTPASDTFSLCVILYELLTLVHPFDGATTPEEMMRAHQALPPTRAEAHKDPRYGRVPRALSQLLTRGLALDPGARFASTTELEASLQKWLEGASPVVCPGTLMQRLFARAIYLIDQHPVAYPIALVVLFCVGLGLTVNAGLDLILR